MPTGTPRLDHHALADSLAGTDVDGQLAVDEHGDLVISLQVRDLFEYFLSTGEEVPLAEIRAFLEGYANERLPASATAQLMSLFDRYVDYKRQAAELYSRPLAPASQQTAEYYLETLDNTFDSLRQLRRRHLDAQTVDAFFGLEEEYGQYTLDRMALQLDPELTPDERSQLMAELRSDLSEPLRRSEHQKAADFERAQQVQEIMATSADADEARTALGQFLALEDADRVVAHHREKQAFQQRVEQYMTARAALDQRGLPDDEYQAMTERLRRQHFPDEREQILARTYEARDSR